ncbi:unnamed protein product (macronuclear) [Paramecium tetraurelia]|uniref:Uncharacterized protein n=1 Tax=Paramecium tetraurelia TaxID=5888 RepID=A0BK38_PARTE|nr:uncharacterized protein GSPATT00029535001 [Paramecium tetraurelia]CAK58905.1 unnamed protein product [Paramecium tetraurelia]|eukprot:XP_001426303.1 hypothetical protein (macronuclear) [Paramecium tetraurelia strain d4-2]
MKSFNNQIILVKSLTKYKKQVSKNLRADNIEDELIRIQDSINGQMKICYTQALQETDNECLELERIKFLLEINEVQEARIFLDNMIKKYPKNIEAYLYKGIREIYLANILEDEKSFDKIIDLFDEAISLQPENVQLYENKARHLEKQQKWVEALKCINQALSKSPDSLHYYLQKFKPLQKLNLIKTARQCCRMIPNVYYDTDQEMEQCDF